MLKNHQHAFHVGGIKNVEPAFRQLQCSNVKSLDTASSCACHILPHDLDFFDLFWMTGTVTSVSTYQSLSSRPVRNRAFIFILRMAITFNDPSKVSEGLERTDTLQMLLAESWKVHFLRFAWTVRIKIGNIQQNRGRINQRHPPILDTSYY